MGAFLFVGETGLSPPGISQALRRATISIRLGRLAAEPKRSDSIAQTKHIKKLANASFFICRLSTTNLELFIPLADAILNNWDATKIDDQFLSQNLSTMMIENNGVSHYVY